MDPNETLRELRSMTRQKLYSEGHHFDADRMAELFEALDNWIMHQGALPSNWYDAQK